SRVGRGVEPVHEVAEGRALVLDGTEHDRSMAVARIALRDERLEPLDGYPPSLGQLADLRGLEAVLESGRRRLRGRGCLRAGEHREDGASMGPHDSLPPDTQESDASALHQARGDAIHPAQGSARAPGAEASPWTSGDPGPRARG